MATFPSLSKLDLKVIPILIIMFQFTGLSAAFITKIIREDNIFQTAVCKKLLVKCCKIDDGILKQTLLNKEF